MTFKKWMSLPLFSFVTFLVVGTGGLLMDMSNIGILEVWSEA